MISQISYADLRRHEWMNVICVHFFVTMASVKVHSAFNYTQWKVRQRGDTTKSGTDVSSTTRGRRVSGVVLNTLQVSRETQMPVRGRGSGHMHFTGKFLNLSFEHLLLHHHTCSNLQSEVLYLSKAFHLIAANDIQLAHVNP